MQQENNYKSLGEIFFPYIKTLWGMRKNIMAINSIVLVLAIAFLFIFVKPYYESTITILPDYGSKSDGLSALGGLASLAGVSFGEGANKVGVYQNLLASESVLEPVLFNKYLTLKSKDSLNLFEYFEIENDKNEPKNISDRMIILDLLKNMNEANIRTRVEETTNILYVTVRMPEPELSGSVVNKLVESLDTYIRIKRKSNASIQRAYIEKRISEVDDSLKIAENDLLVFQMNNRNINQSPTLILYQTRLNRNVQILQTVYVQLTSQLEIAKIEEIKDSPVLNVKEWAKNPVYKTGPKRINAILIVMIFSFLITSLYYLFFWKIINYFRRIVMSSK